MDKKTVFVTGATGLVGSHLLYYLLRSGYSVWALCRKSSRIEDVEKVFSHFPGGESLCHRIEWVEGDILQPETLEEPIKRADCVFHCAAVVSFSGGDKERLRHTNIQGTEHIAALCLKYKVRLCYVSSIAALGDAAREGEFVDENTEEIPGRPHSEYSHSKSDSEKVVWHYIDRGMDAVIVCPSIILGVGASHKSSSQLYATASRGIPFYTQGVCGYVDVRDVCCLMIRLAEDRNVKGERFVLNGGNYSYRELFSEIAKVNGKRPPYFYMRPWITESVWRLLAVWGGLTGRKPAFTKETARSAHRKSFYSNRKIVSLYPDFQFYPLSETVQYIRENWNG